jgi:hypothetical protein
VEYYICLQPFSEIWFGSAIPQFRCRFLRFISEHGRESIPQRQPATASVVGLFTAVKPEQRVQKRNKPVMI